MQQTRLLSSYSISPPLGKGYALRIEVERDHHTFDWSMQVANGETAALPGVFIIPFSFHVEQQMQVQVLSSSKVVAAGMYRVGALMEERRASLLLGNYTVNVTIEEENVGWNASEGGMPEPSSLFGNPFPVLDLAIETAPVEELVIVETVTLELEARHLPKSGLLASPDAFFQLRRSVEGVSESNWPTVATSHVVHGRDILWPSLQVPLRDLCNNDVHRTICVEIIDKKKHGHLIGSFQTSVDALSNANAQIFTLRLNGHAVEHASVHVVKCSLNRVEKMQASRVRSHLVDLRTRLQNQFSQNRGAYPMLFNPFSFVNYMQSGLKIKLSFAIDFTGSNGHPLDPGSLHAKDESNQYVAAIRSIGSIVRPYAVPQMGAYGFGGALGNYTGAEVSHCFQLNMDKEEVTSIEEVLTSYNSAFDLWSLSGPTHFSSVIQSIERKISARDGFYHLLVIMTDGVVDDMLETVEAIVRCSSLPFSLIIVGVGDSADWSKMDTLDADDRPLNSQISHCSAVRDCVQFVPFSEYKGQPKQLSEAVLAEIPRQVCEWAALIRLDPNQLRHA